MKTTRVILSLVGGSLIGFYWVWVGPNALGFNQIYTAAILALLGFAIFCLPSRQPSWKFVAFCQIPIVGLFAWNIARIQSASGTFQPFVFACALLMIGAAITALDFRIQRASQLVAESKHAEQGSGGDP